MKLLPLTVRVNADPPAGVLVGFSNLMEGIGLSGAVMVKVAGFEIPPPGAGLNTVIDAVPWAAMSVEEMEAVN